METFAQLVLAGLTNGSVYGLIGLSLALIYNTTRIVNFAQGEFVMLGTMLGILFLLTLGLPAPLAILSVLLVVAIVGWLMERLVYAPLVRRAAPAITVMMGTFSGAIIITGGALVAWGPNQLYVPPVFSLDPLRLGVVTTTTQQMSIVVMFAGLMLATWWLLHRTHFGLTVRATGVSPRTAMLMGIRVRRIVRFSFVASAVMSALAGVLVGPLLGGSFAVGLGLTVKGFMAAILGGLGNPFAAAAGGLMIGLMEALVGGYGSSLYAEPIVFALMLLVLLARPYGLLGEFEAKSR